ncbi:MAG: endo alpha-1,4 polygalactosaminidase [Pseudomonadota bacterium]
MFAPVVARCFLACCAGLLLLAGRCAAADAPDIAFYYGTRPPLDALRHYDQVVIQPNQLRPEEVPPLLASGPEIFAYVSVGEVARNAVDVDKIDQRWVIGTNTAWNSLVMDLAGSGWRDYLLREHFGVLWQQGYRAFFLDTMDSYLIPAKDGPARQRQEDGMVALMATIKQRFPGVKLIYNRGFELLERHAQYADALLAESLFHGYDPVSKKHAPTPEANRQWLIQQLRRTRDQFGVSVIVLDYVDPGDWATAEATAKEILALGFTPWVANGDLTWLGQGRLRHVPRTLLALIDGAGDGHGQDQLASPLFKHLAMPLEYEGYALEYRNIEHEALPNEPISGRYAGVVAWLSARSSGQQAGVCARLQPEVRAGLPVAFFGSLPAGAACRQLLGDQQNGRAPGAGLQVVAQQPAMGRPGTAPALKSWGLPDSFAGAGSTAWLQLRDRSGARFDPIQIGAFGGLALDPYVMQYGADGSASWLLDPFAFLRAALRLPAQPVFELSTDNGRRIGLVDIRGDRLALADSTGQRPATALLPLLQTQPLPATLALIEAEFDTPSLADDERRARRRALDPLLALPQLELASHTYSHPYYWPVFDGERDYAAPAHRYSVSLPQYAAELQREIAAPFDWLRGLRHDNSALQPPLLIWSGDGKPGPAALAIAQQAGVSHYGGGGIDWRFGPLKLAQLAPAARPTPWGTQVLAPLVDENTFARLWYGEALNYRQVLDWNRQLGGNSSFGMRRLKPWSLSFHADAVLRPAGVTLLQELLRAQAAEPLNGLYVSEYVQRVRAFQQASLAKDLNGNWSVHGNGLHSVRLPVELGWPARNPAVAGAREDSSGRYLQLGQDRVQLRFGARAPDALLVDASAPLQSWQSDSDGTLRFRFAKRNRVEFRARVPAGCQLSQQKPLPARTESGLSRYLLTGAAAQAEVQLVCR